MPLTFQHNSQNPIEMKFALCNFPLLKEDIGVV